MDKTDRTIGRSRRPVDDGEIDIGMETNTAESTAADNETMIGIRKAS